MSTILQMKWYRLGYQLKLIRKFFDIILNKNWIISTFSLQKPMKIQIIRQIIFRANHCILNPCFFFHDSIIYTIPAIFQLRAV